MVVGYMVEKDTHLMVAGKQRERWDCGKVYVSRTYFLQ
jgi:hypothetical protein